MDMEIFKWKLLTIALQKAQHILKKNSISWMNVLECWADLVPRILLKPKNILNKYTFFRTYWACKKSQPWKSFPQEYCLINYGQEIGVI